MPENETKKTRGKPERIFKEYISLVLVFLLTMLFLYFPSEFYRRDLSSSRGPTLFGVLILLLSLGVSVCASLMVVKKRFTELFGTGLLLQYALNLLVPPVAYYASLTDLNSALTVIFIVLVLPLIFILRKRQKSLWVFSIIIYAFLYSVRIFTGEIS